MIYKNHLMDEEFFFLYHMKRSREEFYSYPIRDRKELIDRYIKQKNKEHSAMENAKKRIK